MISASNIRVKVAKDDYLLRKARRRNACVFCVCCADLSLFIISIFCNQPGVTSFYESTAYAKVKSVNSNVDVTKITFYEKITLCHNQSDLLMRSQVL